jgi:glycosyltransferase involved in cell wall biosynthesis
VIWLFIGGGALLESLKIEVARCGLTSVHFKPYQPRGLLAQSLSIADVHLVSLRPELEGLIVPSKFYGIAAAGRPTIFVGDRNGEISRILAKTGGGLSVEEGDGHALAEAIVALAADPARCTAMGRAARRSFESEFDRPHALARWQALLHEMAQLRSRAGRNGSGLRRRRLLDAS